MTTAAAISESTSFVELLMRDDTSAAAVAAHLDALEPAERARQIRQVGGRAKQKRLWELTAENPLFTLEELVPQSLGDGKTVIYAGKNSLPMFTVFEKRFTRANGMVVGYNHQSNAWITGPGYFTVVNAPDRPRELLFDYTRTPDAKPCADWPEARTNARGFSKLVYHNLHDFCRRVSRDVLIGSATRLGKDMDSYFILSRL